MIIWDASVPRHFQLNFYKIEKILKLDFICYKIYIQALYWEPEAELKTFTPFFVLNYV